MKMLRRVADKIESKRNSDKTFWKIQVLVKDIAWHLLCFLNYNHNKTPHKRKTSYMKESVPYSKKFLKKLNPKLVYGPKKINVSQDELIVLCLVKNGEEYIADFIKHYFSLGAKHIVFLDNGSTDKTIEIAKSFRNVTILRTLLDFKDNNILMRRYLIDKFAQSRWSLCVDIDELWDYPYSEIISLKSMLEYLNERKYTAVVSQMLDMFSLNNKKEANIENCQYYNLSDIEKKDYDCKNIVSNKNIKSFWGGVRKTIFNINPYLTKHSLVFNDGKIKFLLNQHKCENARVADFSCVLYHYKFTKTFPEKVKEAVDKENYWRDSVQYKAYQRVLKKCNEIRFPKKSFKLKSNIDLIKKKFLVVSEDYTYLMKSILTNQKDKAPESLQEKIPMKIPKNNKNDITVVIGARNRFDYRIENSLKSIRSQDYPQEKIKIILVDYGSRKGISENYKKICKKYKCKYMWGGKRSKWNRSHALNIGIRMSKTKYILTSDIDMVFQSNYIKEAIKELEKNPKQIIITRMLDIPKSAINSEINVKQIYPTLLKKSNYRGGQNYDYFFGKSINFGLTRFYKLIRGYDEKFSDWGFEDDDLIFRFMLIGLKIKDLSSKTSFIHQWHEKFENIKKEDIQKIIEKNKKYFISSSSVKRNNANWGRIKKQV